MIDNETLELADLKQQLDPRIQHKQFVNLVNTFDQYPLKNEDIWLSVIGAVTLSRKDTPFLDSDRISIIQKYLETRPKDIPVTELVLQAGVADLGRNGFLRRVCFNYDFADGHEERLKQAMVELAAGQREVVYHDRLGTEYWSPVDWAQGEFERLSPSGMGFAQQEWYIDPVTFKKEKAFRPTGGNPGWFDRICWISNSLGWEYKEYLENHYSATVISLLERNQILKPMSCRDSLDFNHTYPTIVTLASS